MKNIIGVIGMIVILILAMTHLIGAADYPTKPITIINAQSPGGSTDTATRIWGVEAEKALGQPIVYLNKPGASGLVGMTLAKEAAPDGYTAGVNTTGQLMAIEWELVNGRKPPVTREDMILLGAYTMSPALIVVPPNSPWKTLADLIRDCKAKPEHYVFGSGGLYGGSHLPGEVFMRTAGIKCRHVPHQGGGPTLTALVGGHIDLASQWPMTSIPLARGNKLRILAVMGEKRLKSIPDVPTCKELGIDAVWHEWIGLTFPAKTPMPIVQKFREVVKIATESDYYVKTMENRGDQAVYTNADELDKFSAWEIKRISELFKVLLQEEKTKK